MKNIDNNHIKELLIAGSYISDEDAKKAEALKKKWKGNKDLAAIYFQVLPQQSNEKEEGVGSLFLFSGLEISIKKQKAQEYFNDLK